MTKNKNNTEIDDDTIEEKGIPGEKDEYNTTNNTLNIDKEDNALEMMNFLFQKQN